jgi:hypothetical protein
VLGDFLKRLFNSGVLLLATLGFFLMPLGRKTPAQHLTAIFATPPAREAAAAFTGVARRAAEYASAEFAALREGRGSTRGSNGLPSHEPPKGR